MNTVERSHRMKTEWIAEKWNPQRTVALCAVKQKRRLSMSRRYIHSGMAAAMQKLRSTMCFRGSGWHFIPCIWRVFDPEQRKREISWK